MKLGKLQVASTPFTQFVNKHWKNILIIGLVILVLTQLQTCSKKNVSINDLHDLAKFNDSNYNAVIKTWKDKYGEEHVLAENISAEKKVLARFADSIGALLKIKPGSITGISKTTSTIDLNVKVRVDTLFEILPCPEGDSIRTAKQLNFSWQDKWMSVNGTVGEYGDSVHVVGTDILTRVDYWKRKWLLGKKRYYTDFSNSNTHITVTGYKGVQVKETKYNWSIGPFLGLGYSPTQFDIRKPQVQVGISLQRSLIKF